MKAIPKTCEKTPTFRVKSLCALSPLFAFVYILRALSLIKSFYCMLMIWKTQRKRKYSLINLE